MKKKKKKGKGKNNVGFIIPGVSEAFGGSHGCGSCDITADIYLILSFFFFNCAIICFLKEKYRLLIHLEITVFSLGALHKTSSGFFWGGGGVAVFVSITCHLYSRKVGETAFFLKLSLFYG